MKNELRKAVNAAGVKAQYDACVKRLLGQKEILAHILVRCVDEFKGMSPKEAVAYIEGEPYIGNVPSEPGLTNAVVCHGGSRIVGINTESTEVNEGLARFDIIFYVHAPANRVELAKIIVNIEAQKDEPTRYDIPIDDDIRREVGEMCNLSEGIEERAIEKGIAKGIAEGEASIIINMHNNGLSAEQIASLTDKNIEEVRKIIEKPRG